MNIKFVLGMQHKFGPYRNSVGNAALFVPCRSFGVSGIIISFNGVEQITHPLAQFSYPREQE